MKNKKTVVSIVICILAVALSFASLTLKADGVPYTECSNNPSLNNGHCMPRAEGNGYACIVALWQKDCYKTRTVDDEMQTGN